MKSYLPNYRQSPRKVRLVADLIKGKTVSMALSELALLPKRASLPIKKLILSAVANAKENNKVDAEKLMVKDVRIDKGIVLKRMMPRAHGRAFGIKKRTSHIHIILEEDKEKAKSPKLKVGNEKKSTEKMVAAAKKTKKAK